MPNLENIYSQVINEQPEQQQPMQNPSTKTVKFQNQTTNANQTISQKKMEILQDNHLNLIIKDMKNLIRMIKQKIQTFLLKQEKRQHQLRIYNKKLDQLGNMLNYSIGMDCMIKIFILKKVLTILKELKKIDQKQFEIFMKLIVQQEVYIKNNGSSSIISTNGKGPQRPYQVRTKKSLTLNPSQTILNKCLRQSKYSSQFFKINQRKNFNQIIQRVDKIRQKNIKSWYTHHQDIKQINQFQQKNKYNKNSFFNKSIQNRNILKRVGSMKNIININDQDNEKLDSYLKQNQIEEKERRKSYQLMRTQKRMKTRHIQNHQDLDNYQSNNIKKKKIFDNKQSINNYLQSMKCIQKDDDYDNDYQKKYQNEQIEIKPIVLLQPYQLPSLAQQQKRYNPRRNAQFNLIYKPHNPRNLKLSKQITQLRYSVPKDKYQNDYLIKHSNHQKQNKIQRSESKKRSTQISTAKIGINLNKNINKKKQSLKIN